MRNPTTIWNYVHYDFEPNARWVNLVNMKQGLSAPHFSQSTSSQTPRVFWNSTAVVYVTCAPALEVHKRFHQTVRETAPLTVYVSGRPERQFRFKLHLRNICFSLMPTLHQLKRGRRFQASFQRIQSNMPCYFRFHRQGTIFKEPRTAFVP